MIRRTIKAKLRHHLHNLLETNEHREGITRYVGEQVDNVSLQMEEGFIDVHEHASQRDIRQHGLNEMIVKQLNAHTEMFDLLRSCDPTFRKALDRRKVRNNRMAKLHTERQGHDAEATSEETRLPDDNGSSSDVPDTIQPGTGPDADGQDGRAGHLTLERPEDRGREVLRQFDAEESKDDRDAERAAVFLAPEGD